MDSHYAMRQGMITPSELDRILKALVRCGLPIWTPKMNASDAGGRPLVLEGLEQFREHLGGLLNITLPEGIGKKCEVNHMDAGVIIEGIDFLRKRAGDYNNPAADRSTA